MIKEKLISNSVAVSNAVHTKRLNDGRLVKMGDKIGGEWAYV